MSRPGAGVHGRSLRRVAPSRSRPGRRPRRRAARLRSRPPIVEASASRRARVGQDHVVSRGIASGGGATIPSVPVQRPASAAGPRRCPPPRGEPGDVGARARLVEDRLREALGPSPGIPGRQRLQRIAGRAAAGHGALRDQPDRQRGGPRRGPSEASHGSSGVPRPLKTPAQAVRAAADEVSERRGQRPEQIGRRWRARRATPSARDRGRRRARPATAGDRGPRPVTLQPVSSTRSASQPTGALSASTPSRSSTDVHASAGTLTCPPASTVGRTRGMRSVARVHRQSRARAARRRSRRSEHQPARTPMKSATIATGPSARRASVPPRARSFAVQVDGEREVRAAPGQVDRRELEAQVGGDDRAAAGQVVDPQREGRGDQQLPAVEPRIDRQPRDDGDRPRVGGRAGAADRLGQLQRAGDQVAHVGQHRRHVGGVIGQQVVPPVGERAERIGEQLGAVERRGAARCPSSPSSALRSAPAAPRASSAVPSSVARDLPRLGDDGLRARQVHHGLRCCPRG